MKIIYNFPDKSIKFDCFSCPDVCCHVANTLLMNEQQKNNVLTQNKLLSSFINQKGEIHSLNVGKQCWFLQDNGCELHAQFGGDGKPLTCQIYPFKAWRLSEDIYFVDYIPCPNFTIVDDESGISYEYLNELIEDYIKLTTPRINPLVKDVRIENVHLHLDQHSKLLEYPIYYNDFPYKNIEKKQEELAFKLLFLYPQVSNNPVAIKNFKNRNKFKSIYFENIVNVLNNSNFSSIQNLYLLTLKLFNQKLLSLKGGD